MKKKQYAVLGLGIFGSTVATTLYEKGCEVLAIDKNMTCVERISDEVTKAVVADVTSIEELQEVGMEDIDVAVIAIGSNLESAVLATMAVKELGIPYVIAKAKNKQFLKILEKVGADRVIRPEKDMGMRVAKSLLGKNIVDLVELDDENAIIEINLPESWVGQTLEQLDLRNKYSMNVLGVREHENAKLIPSLGPDYMVKTGDRFLVLASVDKLKKIDTL